MSVQKITGLIVLLTSFFIFNVSIAEEEASQPAEDFAALAGYNYELVSPPQPTESKDKIEVLEIFWYGCPHCYHFEPELEVWLERKPDDVIFRRMPGIFRSSWRPHARAFYAAEKLGILDKIHTPLFDAIHRDNQQLNTDEEILEFVDGLEGVDGKAFRKAFNSFSVEGKVKQAMRLSRAYGIQGVPSLIVNGKYFSSGSIAGSYPELLKVIDALVDKERSKSAGTD